MLISKGKNGVSRKGQKKTRKIYKHFLSPLSMKNMSVVREECAPPPPAPSVPGQGEASGRGSSQEGGGEHGDLFFCK